MAGVGLARVVWIPSAIGLVGSIGYFAMQPYKVEEPGKLTSYSASDKSVALKHPSNWKSKSLSMHGVSASVRFEPAKDTVFELDTDLAGSLMADMSRSSDNAQENLDSTMQELARQNPELAKQLGNVGQPGKKKSPVEKLHEMGAGALEKDLKNYKEGAAVKTTLAGLEAVESDFTASGQGLWGPRPVSGKRLTALLSDRSVHLIYYGPADQMKTLGPVFQQMRESIQFGNGMGGQ